MRQLKVWISSSLVHERSLGEKWLRGSVFMVFKLPGFGMFRDAMAQSFEQDSLHPELKSGCGCAELGQDKNKLSTSPSHRQEEN